MKRTTCLLTLSTLLVTAYSATAFEIRVAGPSPGATSGGTATVLDDGQIVVVQGGNAHAWDPAARKWTDTALRPERYFHVATKTTDGRIVLTGGIATDSSRGGQANAIGPTHIFKANHWEPGPGLLTPRIAHAAVALPSHEVLVIGGSSSASHGVAFGPLLASVEVVGENTTTKRKPISTPRAYHTATLLHDGRILVIGGVDDEGTALSSVEIYDPQQDTWQMGPALRIARSRHTATLLHDNSILVVGGVGDADQVIAAVERLDLKEDLHAAKWMPAGALAEPRSDHQALLLKSGNVLIAGGFRSVYTNNFKERSGYPVGTLQFWNASESKWQIGGITPLPTRDQLAVALPDDRVLLFGGDGYGSATLAWLPVDKENASVAGVQGATITRLNNQRFLVTGGRRRQEASAAALIHDLKTNSWRATQPMRFARSGHKGLQLRDGRVLILGGEIHGVPTDVEVIRNGQKTGERDRLQFPAEIWDPLTGEWTPSRSLKYESNSWAEPALLPNGRVALGVVDNHNRYAPAVHLFRIWNPEDDSLSPLTQVPRTRADGTAVFHEDGHMLYLGGTDVTRPTQDPRCYAHSTRDEKIEAEFINSTTDPCTLVEEDARGGKRLDWWDPIKRSWRELAPASLSLNGMNASPLQDGGVLLWSNSHVMPSKPSDTPTVNAIVLWQPRFGWRTLPVPSGFGQGHVRSALALGEGDVYMRMDSYRSWLWRHDLKQWHAIARDAESAEVLSDFLLEDGSVIAFRERRSLSAFAMLEAVRLNLDAARWELTTQDYIASDYPAAVTLEDGSVFVQHGDMASAQVWLPESDRWRLTGYAPEILSKPRALRLHDGRVMVVGTRDQDEKQVHCHLWDAVQGSFSTCGELPGDPGEAHRKMVLRYMDTEQVLLVYGNQRAFVWRAQLSSQGAHEGEWIATKLQVPASPSVGMPDKSGTPYLNPLASVWNPAKNEWQDATDVLFANALSMESFHENGIEGSVTAFHPYGQTVVWDPATKTLHGMQTTPFHNNDGVKGFARTSDGCIIAWSNVADSRERNIATARLGNLETQQWLQSKMALRLPVNAHGLVLRDGSVALFGRSRSTIGSDSGLLRLRADCNGIEPLGEGEALLLPTSGVLEEIQSKVPPVATPIPLKPELNLIAAWQAQWKKHAVSLMEHPKLKLILGVALLFFAMRVFVNRWGHYQDDGIVIGRRIDTIVMGAAVPLLAISLALPFATLQAIISCALALVAALAARRLWDSVDAPRDRAIYGTAMVVAGTLAVWVLGTYSGNLVMSWFSLLTDYS